MVAINRNSISQRLIGEDAQCYGESPQVLNFSERAFCFSVKYSREATKLSVVICRLLGSGL